MCFFFLWRQRSRVPLRDHFVRHLSVLLSHILFAYNFYLERYGFHIWHVCSLWQNLSNGTKNFDHVTLAVTFDLYLENFNSANNFLTIRHRAFVFGMCVPYDKTFLIVP